MAPAEPTDARASTGIPGLDDILGGGWPRDRLYLVQGDPGAGKTTLGLQFLLEGARRKETVLYVALSESRAEIEAVAQSHGWSLEGVTIFEPLLEGERPLEANSVFHPSEVELRESLEQLFAEVERLRPSRVVFDSLSELRLSAQSALHYRRQILQLKRFFSGRAVTLLLLDDGNTSNGDTQAQSVAHGVLSLQQLPHGYGDDRRRLRLKKVRGLRFRGGHHDYRIVTGGLQVFPRLVAAEHRAEPIGGAASTGSAGLDAMLGGGLDRGTSTLLLGPSGSGKSSLALGVAIAAAQRGEHASFFTFDESLGTLLARAAALGLPLKEELELGRIQLRTVDPTELVPDELVHLVRQSVARPQPTTVVIDSLNGYLQSMPEERFLLPQLHELLAYLAQKGVLTLLVMAQAGLFGPQVAAPVDVSYVADTVLLLRHFEAEGRVRKAISVLKKRTGGHDDAIRELVLTPRGLLIGDALRGLEGVLSGQPHLTGELQPSGAPN